MATADTKIIISGDASGAVKAITDTRKALTEASTQMQSSIKPLAAGMSTLSTAFAGLAGLLAGGALFKAAVSATNEWNGEVGKLAKSLGISTEQASVMGVALDHLGLSSDTVVSATMALSRQLKSNEGDFTALGIKTRDFATGELLPAGEIMARVNTKLGEQKNAVQQNIDGTRLYGKAWADAKGLLKLTTDELERAAQRARDLHLIVGPEGTALTKAYNEQQRDLKLVFQSMEIQLGAALLPTLVKLGAFMSKEGPVASKTFAVALEGLATGLSVTWVSVRLLGNTIGATSAAMAQVLKGNFGQAAAILQELGKDSVDLGQTYADLIKNFGKPVIAEQDAATKRKKISEELQAKQIELENLRAIASGKASAVIVQDDNELTKTRIANAEKVRNALQSAWQASIADARKAGEEATKLLDSAANIRKSGADKAADIRRAQLSEADQAFLNQRDATNFADEATVAALQAMLAAMYGRTENAAKLADQATKAAEQASKYAEKLADPEGRAKAIERIAEAQATAEEARAKIKQQEQAALEETAKAQAKTLADLDAQLTELQNKAQNLQLKVQIEEAEKAIASLKADLDSIKDKTVTVTVNTVQTGQTAAPNSFSSESSMTGFARGGYTGPGGKFQPAGIVHAGEFVTRAEILRQRGALDFLERFNRFGMSVLPGFADGGLVGRLAIPTLRSPQPVTERMAATFNFPGLGSYRATVSADTFRQLQNDFQRAALQKGGRR